MTKVLKDKKKSSDNADFIQYPMMVWILNHSKHCVPYFMIQIFRDLTFLAGTIVQCYTGCKANLIHIALCKLQVET